MGRKKLNLTEEEREQRKKDALTKFNEKNPNYHKKYYIKNKTVEREHGGTVTMLDGENPVIIINIRKLVEEYKKLFE